jgi:iron complex outermembrane receptor protein
MFIPEHSASVWYDHTLPATDARGALTLGIGARLIGSRYADEGNSFKLDAFTVFDAALSYDLGQNTTLSLNVDNLFNTEYVSFVETWSNPDTAFYGDPRMVKLSLRHTW